MRGLTLTMTKVQVVLNSYYRLAGAVAGTSGGFKECSNIHKTFLIPVTISYSYGEEVMNLHRLLSRKLETPHPHIKGLKIDYQQ